MHSLEILDLSNVHTHFSLCILLLISCEILFMVIKHIKSNFKVIEVLLKILNISSNICVQVFFAEAIFCTHNSKLRLLGFLLLIFIHIKNKRAKLIMEKFDLAIK